MLRARRRCVPCYFTVLVRERRFKGRTPDEPSHKTALFRLLLAFEFVNYACTKRAAGIASNPHFQIHPVSIDRSVEAQRVRRAPQNRPGAASRRAPFCASSLKAARWNTCGRASVTGCIDSDAFAIELAICDRRVSRPRPDGGQSTNRATVDFEVEKNGTHRLRLFPWALKIHRPLSGDLAGWGRAQGRRRH